jgi:apolipoprotein N-acyltransferase
MREAVRVLYAAAILNRSDVLVLPEGVADSADDGPPIPPFELSAQMPVLFGGARGTTRRYQSAFAYDGRWQIADKSRLVAFGEYVPCREQLPLLESFRLPGGDLSPGDRPKAVTLGGITLGPMICFEALFYDLGYAQAANGAQVLAVMSVDDWYMNTAAPEQLKAATVWRAVETGLPTVRAASLGYSFAVDSRGRILGQAPLGETFALHVRLRVADVSAGMAAARWIPSVLAAFCALPLAGFLAVRRRPNR